MSNNKSTPKRKTISNSNTAPKPDTAKNVPPPQTKSNPGNPNQSPNKK